MKSRKAVKRIRQIGRPRKEGVKRYANGRIARGDSTPADKDPAKTAREARQRIFGISEDDARREEMGSALGRLKFAGREHGISQEQYEVGRAWESLFRQYVRIREGLAPDAPSPAAMMLDIAPHRDLAHPDAEPGGPTPVYETQEDRDARIVGRWLESYLALARLQTDFGRPSPYEALFAACARDIMPTGALALGNLRIALNTLGNLWRK